MKKPTVLKQSGMALVEIIIGATIISIGILAIGSSYSTYVSYALANQRNVQASYILEESIEVISFFRDKGWTENISSLTPGQAYYLNWNGATWATTTTPEMIDNEFVRKITLSNVSRDANDKISVSGTLDPNTKLITATVEYWQDKATTTRTLSSYIANIYEN